jgi:homocysteine S-methyltransferase
MQPILDRLAQGSLLADGAMGTTLHAAGVPMDACFDALNLTDPARVAAVHRAFLAAGASLVETNTFGANHYKLRTHSLTDSVTAINRAAVEIARKVAAEFPDRDIYVAGAVGPLGIRIAPYGRLQPEQAFDAFREQIAALHEAGADAILLETFTDLHEIDQAIRAARSVDPKMPVIASMTFTRDERTVLGDSPREVAESLLEAGADVIGVNCSAGPSQIARIARAMRSAQPNALISAMPNAGFPESINGRVMYPATPEYFGDYALTVRDLGVALIGGCCGVLPEHIAAMRTALDRPADHAARITVVGELSQPLLSAINEQPTDLARKLAAGQFVVTVEMAPPRGFATEKALAAARLLHDAGVDTVDVSDSPRSRMRMSPWAVCHAIQTQIGMDTILHFPTRGRNLLRVQGDLLAAHALGVRNIFVVMGDPTNIGDYPDAHDTYDVVPSGLIKLIKKQLNTGLDQAGNSIGQPTTFSVGCALNMGAPDLDQEIKTLQKKIEAGADFALTQSVYEPSVVEIFLKRYRELHGDLALPVLVGVLPLYGARHAAFLHNEVPGISIPDAVRSQIDAAGDVAPQVGVALAAELLNNLAGMVQGAYLIPPFGRFDMAAEIMDGLRVH